MAMNLTQKILKNHLVEGEMITGQPIKIKIDQTLTQDATGTMAYLQFEAIGLDKVKNELAVSYVDHNTIQVGFENADDHEYLRSVAAKKGVVFSRPGNGICHQVHYERFAIPGKTSLGSDSHTPTSGGLAMISIGAGGLDVALAMAGEPFTIISPKVVEIRLNGQLRPFVTAKDIILKVLEKYGVNGNANSIFEYTGEGVKTLSVPERSTICNMGAECGVTTSLFPSDEITKDFLAAQGRVEDYTEQKADDNAKYDETYEINLNELVPMVALPHSPGNVVPVKDIENKKVNQVLIGSCTNSSYADLVKVGEILDGHTVSPDVSLGIAPGSREVLLMISQDGTLEKMVKAGARILESACGFCIGNHMSPGTNGVSLRTNNRNFEGRSGTKSGEIYLVSPETAALSAIIGVVVDPLNQDIISPFTVVDPETFITDDSMLIFPPENNEDIKIVRGPNIGAPPTNEKLPEVLSGKVMLKVGDKITTDHIMPAGQRLKYRSNIPEYSKYVFEPVDETFPSRALAAKEKGEHNFIIAGESYGQGSSREHAAICPMYLGVKAVISKSFERIHKANLCNFGILPLNFKDKNDYDKIEQNDEVVIEDVKEQIFASKEMKIKNITKNEEYTLILDITYEEAEMIISGGKLNLIKEKKNG